MFKLDTFAFNTKAEAKEAIRYIMNHNINHEPLDIVQTELVTAAAKMHHNYEQKFNTKPIAYITTNKNKFNKNAFYIVYKDETIEVLSFTKIWKTAEQADKTNFANAARNAIIQTIVSFKQDCFRNRTQVQSYVSSAILTWNEVHIDHAYPKFAKILSDFVSLYGRPPIIDKGEYYEFLHQEDKDHFKKFHDKRANLRILSVAENLSHKYED